MPNSVLLPSLSVASCVKIVAFRFFLLRDNSLSFCAAASTSASELFGVGGGVIISGVLGELNIDATSHMLCLHAVDTAYLTEPHTLIQAPHLVGFDACGIAEKYQPCALCPRPPDIGQTQQIKRT